MCIFLQLVNIYLTREGYQVMQAENGEAGIAIAGGRFA